MQAMTQDGVRATSLKFRIAAVGALAAALGDVLMLAFALGHASHSSNAGHALLLTGTALGFLLIPTYYLGYHALAEIFPGLKRPSFVVSTGMVATFGALTHGLTGLDIRQALTSGATTRLPSAAFAEPSALVVCAVLAALAAVAASALVVLEARRAASRSFRTLAVLNPIVVTIALTALAKALGAFGEYLGPAAPNIAHLAFFLACQRLQGPARPPP